MKTTDSKPVPVVALWFWDTIDRRFGLGSYRAATLRWRDRNARLPHVCACGAGGTVRVVDRGGQMGSVAPEWWRCEEHATVPLTVPWRDGAPMVNQTREACGWRSGPIATGVVEKCGCGTHLGGAMGS